MMAPQTSLAVQYGSAPAVENDARPLRVGVLLDSITPAGWVRQILDELRGGRGFELVLIIAAEKPKTKLKPRTGERSLLARAWDRLYPSPPLAAPDAFIATSIVPADYTGEVIYIAPGARHPEPYAEELEKIRSANLDVIVNLSESGQAFEVGDAARFGAWAFDVDDTGRAANSWQRDPARISEHHSGNVIATEIRIQSGPNKGRTLGRTFSGADPTRPYRGENRLFWRRAALLVQRLRVLRDNGWEYVSSPENCPTPEPELLTRTTPGTFAIARSTLKIVGRGMFSLLRRELTQEQWFVAFRDAPGRPEVLQDMGGFHVIRPPRDRFYADPFVFGNEGRRYIFVEEYRYALRKGLISYMEIDSSGNCGPATTVLEAPYHLSYPFLFRWQGDIYMLPETSAARQVEAFRAVEFPDRWERHAVLMDNVVGYDPTLLQHDGRFWLFLSGVFKHGAENSDLSVFWAEQPFGPWHPHPGNPVVSDVRRARPAGAIFEVDGQLYRPGQDCSGVYGRAITLSRVEVLTTRMYREVPVSRIEPDWYPGNLGSHTFNQDCRIQVTDGRVLAWKFGGRNGAQ
jgi:hypothetical protein